MKKYFVMLIVAMISAMTAAQAQTSESNTPASIPPAEVFKTNKCAYYRHTTWTENGINLVQYEANICQRWEWFIAGTAGFEPETSYGMSVGGEYRFCFYETFGVTTGFEAEMRKLNELYVYEDQKAMFFHPEEWSPAVYATAGLHTGHLLSRAPGKGVELGLKGGLGVGLHHTEFPQANGQDNVKDGVDLTLAWKAQAYVKFAPGAKVSPFIAVGVAGDVFEKYSMPTRFTVSVGFNLNLMGTKKSAIMRY